MSTRHAATIALIALVLATAVTACGQTGPLYLPRNPPPAAQPSLDPQPDEVDQSASEASDSSNPDN